MEDLNLKDITEMCENRFKILGDICYLNSKPDKTLNDIREIDKLDQTATFLYRHVCYLVNDARNHILARYTERARCPPADLLSIDCFGVAMGILEPVSWAV